MADNTDTATKPDDDSGFPAPDPRIFQPVPLPAPPPSGSGGGIDTGGDFVSLLGNAVAGGGTGLYNLTPEQQRAAGTKALLNFGINMLAASGPSFVPRSFGQVLAAGVQGAENSRQASEEAAYTQAGTQRQYQLDQYNAALKQQEQLQKLYGFQLQLARWKQSQKSLGDLTRALLGGNPPAGSSSSGSSSNDSTSSSSSTAGDSGVPAPDSPALASLPKPSDDGGDMSKFNPDLAHKIVAEAVRQGVDPRMALAVAYRESGGDPNVAPGDGGSAIGTFQLHADAAIDGGIRPEDRGDEDANIRAGVRLLALRRAKYGPVGAVIGYHRPVDAEAFAAGKGPGDSGQYAADVINTMRRMPNPSLAAAAGGDAGGGPPAPPAPYQVASLGDVPPPGNGGDSTGDSGDAGSAPPPSPAVQGDVNAILAGIKQAQGGGTPGTAVAGPGGTSGASPPPPGPQPTGKPPAAPGGPSQAPGRPKLDPDLAAAALYGAQQEALKPDGGDPSKPLLEAFRIQLERNKVPVYKPMTADEVIAAHGQGSYNPRNIYFKDQFGHEQVVQQNDPIRDKITESALAEVKDYQDNAKSARAQLDLLDQMDALNELIKNDPAGKGSLAAGYISDLEGLAKAAGLSNPGLDASMSGVQAYTALSNALRLAAKPKTLTRLTDVDVNLIGQMVPTLNTTYEGRKIIGGLLRQSARRSIDQASAAENTFYQSGPGFGTLQGLNEKLDAQGSIVPHIPMPTGDKPDPDILTKQLNFLNNLHEGDVYIDRDGKPWIKGLKRPKAASTPVYGQ